MTCSPGYHICQRESVIPPPTYKCALFDVFRHVADRVPRLASQHPIFKAAGMEEDFPIALI